jgi:CRISPR/Cas system CSM-associated protein Csm2 small subunit
MTDKWQQEISNGIKNLKLSLETLRFQIKLTPDPEKKKFEDLTKEIENHIRVIEEDKSKGVHNFDYAKRLMGKVEEKVSSAKRTISK